MSPFNDNLDQLDDDGENSPELSNLKRAAAPVALRGPSRRSKRFKTGRRSNSINGMQRRRNKRMSW